jgi:hypothetical protein
LSIEVGRLVQGPDGEQRELAQAGFRRHARPEFSEEGLGERQLGLAAVYVRQLVEESLGGPRAGRKVFQRQQGGQRAVVGLGILAGRRVVGHAAQEVGLLRHAESLGLGILVQPGDDGRGVVDVGPWIVLPDDRLHGGVEVALADGGGRLRQ